MTLLTTLEDLDFADELALVFHTHQQIQEATSRLSIIFWRHLARAHLWDFLQVKGGDS